MIKMGNEMWARNRTETETYGNRVDKISILKDVWVDGAPQNRLIDDFTKYFTF